MDSNWSTVSAREVALYFSLRNLHLPAGLKIFFDRNFLDDAISSSEEADDPEYLELREREQIVERYDKGPEQDVDPWENPDFELYKVTDRYGFIQ